MGAYRKEQLGEPVDSMILEAVRRPSCKKIRITSLGIMAVSDDVLKLVECYQAIMIDHDPHLRARHQKLVEILQYGICGTPVHLRNQKSFSHEPIAVSVPQASGVIEKCRVEFIWGRD